MIIGIFEKHTSLMRSLWLTGNNKYDERRIIVKFTLATGSILILSFVGQAQSGLPTRPTYSSSELKQLIRNAHTPAEFNSVADYFDGKQLEFLRKAKDENAELVRLLALPHLCSKYPSPCDNATGLIQYFDLKSEEFGRRANSYRMQAKKVGEMTTVAAKP